MNNIFTLTKINIRIALRFKRSLIKTYIIPLIIVFLSSLILIPILNLIPQFGPWNKRNFLLIPFINCNVVLLQIIIINIPVQFNTKEHHELISTLMNSSFNRFNLFYGIILSHLIIISIPFTIFLVLCYIYYPLSLITLISILGLFLAIYIIFIGFGLITGVLEIHNKKRGIIITVCINVFIFASLISGGCFELFPDFIQIFIILNPLYYVFDLLYLIWLENDIFFSIIYLFFFFFNLIFLYLFFILSHSGDRYNFPFLI